MTHSTHTLWSFVIPDIENECEEQTDNCEQLCIDTPEGFDCGCSAGYLLNADGFSCSGKYS